MEKRDFFISYTNKDEAWAVWIANTLITYGYTVYAQKLDIRPGDNFIEKMNEFLENSGNFIAVWSKAYSESRFCMTELQAAFHEWHKERINCLLPVRIDTSPIKPLYSALVHVDLSSMDAAAAKTLTDAVRHAVPLSVTATEKLDEAEALYQCGENYYFGIGGVEQNYAKAIEYWEQAAEKGNTDALNDLGYLYESGQGTAQDYYKARTYYEQAAQKGNAIALYNLGCLYDWGQGLAQNYAKARKYYERAAEKGSASALYNLGWIYEYGHGVEIDYAKALQYYRKAANASGIRRK